MLRNRQEVYARTHRTAAEGADLGASFTAEFGPLPRPQRKKRRGKQDRGLPPDEDFLRLARDYLVMQRELWPKLAQSGALPEPTDAVLADMASDFKERHRGRHQRLEKWQTSAQLGAKLAGGYFRYSCDNSTPNSINDQMVNCLRRAKQEGRFIPWACIYADYSFTGRDSSRAGYLAYKAVLLSPDLVIETTYIDDFTRASRDETEWWKLAYVIRRSGRRLIGASDNFDLADPNSDMMIVIFGLVSRLFLKRLSQKVRRGMRGTARRGGILGKLSLGFTCRCKTDERGRAILRHDGAAQHEPCVCPLTADDPRLAYEPYVEQCWSLTRIARELNRRAVV